jgi:alpha-tubulin suppressor-like RCC1 family protein
MNPEDPVYNRRAFPQTPPAGVSLRAVVAGLEQHFVLATGGTIHGRGNHLMGGLGIGSITNVSGRHRVIQHGGGFVAMVTGAGYSLTLDAEGTAHGWGRNEYGQLGNNSTTAGVEPLPISGVTFQR